MDSEDEKIEYMSGIGFAYVKVMLEKRFDAIDKSFNKEENKEYDTKKQLDRIKEMMKNGK